MQRALISAIAISIICSIVGLFLVLKRHSLFGDALAHVAFGGISLGLFIGIYP
ncbi:MAG: metal ABC transporter permease, partial [Nitrososphaeraceae archaeon]